MHQGWALGCAAFVILCSAIGSVTAEEKTPANPIRVLEATYGGNCAGVAKGNVTKFIASTCDGTDLCNYRVYYKTWAVTLRRAAERPSASTTSAGKIPNPRPVP